MTPDIKIFVLLILLGIILTWALYQVAQDKSIKKQTIHLPPNYSRVCSYHSGSVKKGKLAAIVYQGDCYLCNKK